MDLEKCYKKFNFPAATTFLKQLKNEEIKVTKKEVDDFIKSRIEQQQTTVKGDKKRTLGKIVAYSPLSLIQMDIYDLSKYIKTIKNINIYDVLLMYSLEKYGRIK